VVKDMPMGDLRAHAVTLAKVATLAKIPVITTASAPQGPNGPLIPEIHKFAPHAKYVARRGEINAWDNPDFVAAAKATPGGVQKVEKIMAPLSEDMNQALQVFTEEELKAVVRFFEVTEGAVARHVERIQDQ
jgi:nicotinamidase-related amidase